ncbi:acyl-CoA reductase [Planktosalinus lacus]|uniref:Acyl-CoA reductase n=1 Tax=Planktosalinus lacus TaxID=1526573 RepID=A0A8J2VAN0_9FLAO|nr:acyl-CoA reductase [Planktosalinus lacus]GGD93010.1 acyl-CoA reductase [Planktosalinus lacus]
MTLTERINACIHLGKFLSQFVESPPLRKEDVLLNDMFFDGMLHQIKLAEEHNGWFTNENIRFALKNWSEALKNNHLKEWLLPYSFDTIEPKTVAIVMAGNIPLVGFHDFLSVLMSGHKVLVKQSSKDKHLLPYLAKYLEYVAPGFKGYITFTEDQLSGFDAVIATGSDNTARYFEYYFKTKPHIIRKNRNSVAVLSGKESEVQLSALGEDIFRYYGLGCRNVSKLYVPEDYNFDAFFNAIYPWHTLVNKQKYANNYDYNKAVYLMSEFDFLDNGFFMLKEDTGYSSPIASCFYERYSSKNELLQRLKQDQKLIQCVVSKGLIETEIAFGKSQQPQLWHYADNINTLDFLLNI